MTLVMPRLSGCRSSACHLIEQLGPVTRATVVLDAAGMDASSQSYADELVLRVLANGGAERFEVREATARFARHLEMSARARGVADRLVMTATRPALAGGLR